MNVKVILHFIIKELAEEFEKQVTCSGENTKKYITFAVPVEKKVIKIYKNGEERQKPYPTVLIQYTTRYLTIYQQRKIYGKISIKSLLTILLKEFIKLNVNTETMIKK